MTHLGIVELAELCARQRATSLDLFAELGAWVTSEPAGPTQRWYALACHRHAWHAELWETRSPAIPSSGLDPAVSAPLRSRLPASPDEEAYRVLLDAIIAELDEAAERIDRDLDPTTRRVIAIVRNDLADLLSA